MGTNNRFGALWVSNTTAVTPFVEGTNFWAYGLEVELGSQKIVAAVRDMAGNMTYVTNEVFLTVVTNGSYLYSTAGCVTNIAYSGVGFSHNIGLTWNSQYQLTEIKTNGTSAERNGYDALGRRLWNWDGAETNYFVYDGQQVIADVDSTGGLRRAFTHGLGMDNWLAMTVYTGATAKTYFYLTDHLGTVHAVTDDGGVVIESYRYDAWGRVLGVYDGSGAPLTESAIGNKILWQGREFSWKSGLYYFRARWYDPLIGRWLSNDPIGISGGLNQYVFCGNGPVNFRDPRGLDAFVEVIGNRVNIRVPIRFHGTLTRSQPYMRFPIVWQDSIQRTWSGQKGKWDVHMSVDLCEEGEQEHYNTVYVGDPEYLSADVKLPANVRHWDTLTGGSTPAHEVGHMLNLGNRTETDGSIMGGGRNRAVTEQDVDRVVAQVQGGRGWVLTDRAWGGTAP